ncbi:hypothetical protein SARC_08038 [Sphaeroforma arctica JP610]|uniref:Uncharacterized protein n=1 Tax=Sphaeroforma arctica JP610 TaxID=667725 RepID=A0A0L0FS21_9EUKA|nr:hypothetical protein SARC_08038 [Sphaeroforma arctica JP610]KNC79577.1 hypothetical protein SARC_08038 [Sphaeroforma arctica JP610]|eukprot:XP_014153479.1 hypothetical protein SARC_08038 [Sphaeroforma arctica JP610]
MSEEKAIKVSGNSLLEEKNSPRDCDIVRIGTADSLTSDTDVMFDKNIQSPQQSAASDSDDRRDDQSRTKSVRRLSTLSRMSELVNMCGPPGPNRSSYETLEDTIQGSNESVSACENESTKNTRTTTHDSKIAKQAIFITNTQSSSQETENTSVVSHTGNFFQRMRLVYETKQITGRDYNIFSRWFLLVSGVVNGLVFGGMCMMATDGRKYWGTFKDKRCIIIMSTLGVFLLLAYTCGLLGYCLARRDHPLIRARGNVYLIIVLLSVVCAALNTWMTLQRGSGIFGTQVVWYTVNSTIRVGAVMTFLGAQVVRQRLIYLLFVLHAMDSSPPRFVNAKTYAWVTLWTAIVCIPVAVLLAIDANQYDRIVSIIASLGWVIMLVILAYYTYLCRSVTQAFSDWRTNLFVGVVVTVSAVGVFIVQNTIFTSTDVKVHETRPDGAVYSVPDGVNLIELYFRGFLTFWVLSVCVLQLFAGMVTIVFFDLHLSHDLDPKYVYEMSKEKTTPEDTYGPDRTAVGDVHYNSFTNIGSSSAANVRRSSATNAMGSSVTNARGSSTNNFRGSSATNVRSGSTLNVRGD